MAADAEPTIGGRHRWQRALQIGCMPLALAVALILLVLLNLIIYNPAMRVPWTNNQIAYIVRNHLRSSLFLLLGLQLGGLWVTSIAAALSGAGQLNSDGEMRARLARAQARLLAMPGAVLLLRLLLLADIAIWLLFENTDWLIPQQYVASFVEDIQDAARGYPLLLFAAAAVLLLHLIAGPFLRQRYSIALGALAATFASKPETRGWVALNARLGAGLAGLLLPLWISAVITLAALQITTPDTNTYRQLVDFFPKAPIYLSDILLAAVVALAFFSVYVMGQIVLTPVLTRVAARRAKTLTDPEPD